MIDVTMHEGLVTEPTTTEETLADKSNRLRGDMRNGRTSDKSGKGTLGNGQESGRQARPGIPQRRRNSNTTKRDNATAGSDRPGAKGQSERERPGGGRSGNDDSGASERSEEVTRIGSLERVDDLVERVDNELPIKPSGLYKEHYSKTERNGKYSYYLIADRNQIITPEEYKALPSEKDVKSSTDGTGIYEKRGNVGSPIFPKGKVLSEQEAKELQEPLAAALLDYGEYADKLIATRSPNEDLPPIWGDLTLLEAQILARIMIRRGQKSAAAAEVVRNMVNGSDYISAAIIIVPRVMRTAETLRRPRGRKRKQDADLI